MIKSMTGFGFAEVKSDDGSIRVEIKTINHKYLEISSRFSNHLASFEEIIRKKISKEISRGKVNIFISSPDPEIYSSHYHLNEALAKEIFYNIKKLEGVLSLKEDKSSCCAKNYLGEVLRHPEVLTRKTSFKSQKIFENDLYRVVDLALTKLKSSRLQEGKALAKDILSRITQMKKATVAIEKRLPVLAREYKKSLEKKIKEFIKDQRVDSERLTLEVAMYVKNSDISEEITRLKSHMEAMTKAVGENGEIGKKIDFIGQEMTREANTMGSKSGDVLIANQVIAIKSAIEKIREQAQNVE